MTKPSRQLRGTDETFLQLMQLSGAGLLKLAGFPAEIAEHYEFRAVEFKEKQLQRPDVEGFPVLETLNIRVTIEFQGYTDKYIRYRTLNSMLQICLKSRDEKPVIGIIVYTEKRYQTAALALDKLIAKATDLVQELVLTDYSEAELLAVDPRLIVLAPFTVSPKLDKAILKQKVVQWRDHIDRCYPATEELSEALNIIGLLLLNRFRDLSHQEIIDMLNLDLMQSRAGREIYQMGQMEAEQRGKQAGLAEGKQAGLAEGKQVGLTEGERLVVTRLLEKRFGKLPVTLQARLEQATLVELEQWSVDLLTATCFDDIFKTQ
jgi:predicted transposase YdaD